MPYIPAVQRYGAATRVSPSKQDTDSIEKMDRNSGHYDADAWMNRTSFAQPSYRDRDYITNYHTRPSPAARHDYGYTGSESFGREPWRSGSGYGGYGGYEQAGYREAFYGRGIEGRPYQYADRGYGQAGYEQNYPAQASYQEAYAGVDGRWYQPSQQRDSRDSYYRQQNQSWYPPSARYPAVYPYTPTSQGIYQSDYRQEYVHPQRFHQVCAPHNVVPYSYAPSQPWLTQQWRTAYDDAPTPSTPPNYGLNMNAPAFRPQLKSVTAQDLNKKYRVDKKTRYNVPTKPVLDNDRDIPPPPPSEPYSDFRESFDSRNLLVADGQKSPYNLRQRDKKGRAVARGLSASDQGSDVLASRATPPRSGRSHEPKQYLLPRPQPSSAYIQQASKYAIQASSSRPLLVVLDLNGTLLFRKRKGSSFLARPKVQEFLHYLLTNHHVMVWSSARPDNVERMCQKLFTKDQYEKLIAVWARDKLHIPSEYAGLNVQVYKQLSWIWKDKHLQSQNPDPVDFWNQENTVLIDDSTEKAASEPHNLIQLEEFEARQDQMDSDVLGQVVIYLEKAKQHRDVSAYVHMKTFAYDPETSFDWTAIINDMH